MMTIGIVDILSSATIKTAKALKVSPRWVAVKTLEDDPLIRRKLDEYHDMARAAFVMDRFMRGIGLSGKSFVPMLVGFGWSVATIYHALMVSGSSLWFSIGTGILVAMFGGFWAYGRKHRVDMI